MHYLLLGLACLLSFSSIYSPLDINKGLVAYFQFNHCDGRDNTDGGSFGRLEGGIGCWCGVEDEGLQLDGQTGRVVFEGKVNDYFTTSDFTLSFYFKPEARTVFSQSMISKRAACTDDYSLDIFYQFTHNEVTTIFRESDRKEFEELSPELVDGKWLHYVLVRQGFYARTYINGKLMRESRRCSGVDITNSAPLSIGNSPCVEGGRARRFKGVIDELRVYDRALSDEEVQLLYDFLPVDNVEMDCVS